MQLIEMDRYGAYTGIARRSVLADTFGQWVREQRKARNLLVKTLAERADIIPQNLSRIESGGPVGRDMAERLADALGADRAEALAVWAKGDNADIIRYVTDPDTAEVVESYEGLVTPAGRELAKSLIQQVRENERRYSVGGRKEDTDADAAPETNSKN